MTVAHDDRYPFLFLTQPDKTFFFVFFRLQQPFTWPHCQRYTDADAEALAASVADHSVCNTFLFGELRKKRIRGSLISFEGVLQRWSHERIILARDSVREVTPNITLGGGGGGGGGNSTMMSPRYYVITSNAPWLLMPVSRSAGRPWPKAFADYQPERERRMKDTMALSLLLTRVQAWNNILLKGLTTWILPYQLDHKLTDQMAELTRRAPKLDYVPISKDMFKGWVKWMDEEEDKRMDISEPQIPGNQ